MAQHGQLIPRNMAGQIVGAGAGAAAMYSGREVARMVADVLNNSGAGRRSNTAAAKRRKKKSGEKRAEEPGTGNSSAVAVRYRSLSSHAARKLRVSDRVIVTLANTSTNQYVQYLGMSLTGTTTPTGPANFGSWSYKLGQMRNLYRHFSLRSVKFTFMPNQADSTSGNFFLGWDSDPNNYSNSTDPTTYLAKDTHIITHVLRPASCVWRPSERAEREEKQCLDPQSNRTAEELGYGIVQVYCSNNLAVGVTLGLLLIEVDVEFSNPAK